MLIFIFETDNVLISDPNPSKNIWIYVNFQLFSKLMTWKSVNLV